ncbi:MAG: DUF2949 domain-containing protein [Microcystaceae cyanobacterium]
MNHSAKFRNFINFLRTDLLLSDDCLALVQKKAQTDNDNLPMLLWQYGLISLTQLNSIFEWLEQHCLVL